MITNLFELGKESRIISRRFMPWDPSSASSSFFTSPRYKAACFFSQGREYLFVPPCRGRSGNSDLSVFKPAQNVRLYQRFEVAIPSGLSCRLRPAFELFGASQEAGIQKSKIDQQIEKAVFDRGSRQDDAPERQAL